jgi:hypothetical protein
MLDSAYRYKVKKRAKEISIYLSYEGSVTPQLNDIVFEKDRSF